MSPTLTIDFNKPIALFPLPGCVLLPHNATPLHIFEPRYRTMTRDALDSTGLIAMATTLADDAVDELGRPRIAECVCVGYIVRHDRLPDGRYNILLQGLARAKVLEEVEEDDAGYRRAVLQPTETGTMEIDMDALRRELDVLLTDDTLRGLAGISAVNNWATPELPTTAVTDLVWNALCHGGRSGDERYRVLAEPCPIRRTVRLIALLKRTRRTLEQAEQMGPCTSEHGLGLN